MVSDWQILARHCLVLESQLGLDKLYLCGISPASLLRVSGSTHVYALSLPPPLKLEKSLIDTGSWCNI